MSILLVEDTPSQARLCIEFLKSGGFEVRHVDTGKAALAALEEDAPPVTVLDLNLPDLNGMDILEAVKEQALPTTVVVVTTNASIKTAVQAMQAGAYDYIVKPFNPDRLNTTVRNALDHRRLCRIVDTYREDIDRQQFCGFIGSSLAMQAVYRTIECAAASKATVFVTGESGTGKELCAEAIHNTSPRRHKPIVALNCSAIPRDLVESEVFGHVKGAFTGAVADRDGAAQRAHGGTLFLDEVCEMDASMQAKLLRFLQTSAVQKVGGMRPEPVDVRIVCATNRDPFEEVRQGRFREDLFYRLHVVPIRLPPLRERAEDILEIANHFLQQYAREERKRFRRFDRAVEALFKEYSWPGNVRQLQNVVRNVVVMHDGDSVTPAMLPSPIGQGSDDGGKARPAAPAPVPAPAAAVRSAAPTGAYLYPGEEEIVPLWQVEKDAIERAINLCNGNIPRAAAFLGISASKIYRKKQNWDAESKA
jgi:DNA-binding NtrC family response regulator